MNTWKLRFAILWSGQAVSFLTSTVMQMALIWHLAITTQSAGILALASLAGFAPMSLIGTFAGALVDRWNRKLVMIGADAYLALVALGLGLATLAGDLPVWLVVTVIAVRSVGTAFHTPAISAVTPLMVPDEHLVKASGYTQTVQSVGFIAGTSLAAVLYPLWGVRGMVLLDVVGAVLAGVAVAVVRIPSALPAAALSDDDAAALAGADAAAEATPSGGILAEIGAGFAALREHRGIWALLWAGMVFILAYSPINALFPLMSLDHFGGTTTHASAVEILFAVGMIVGGIVLGVWGGFKNRGLTLCLAILVMGVAITVSGLLPASGFLAFAAASAVMGLAVPFYNGPYMAVIQEQIDPGLLGRVFGAYGSLMSLAMALGLALTGPLAELTGTPLWFVLSGAVTIALAAVTYALPSVRHLETPKS